jgi:SAM-dependent methyltransferase
MKAEFDGYSGNYDELLKDPIRDFFAETSAAFHRRKWLVLQDFFARRRWSTKNRRWLDIGCGKGDLLRLGRSSFEQALGCDPSDEMLKACGDLDVRRQTEDGLLPFADSSFDLVTAVCVYHHLTGADRRAVTKEAWRVLRPGGIFAVFEHNPWNPATRIIVGRTPVDANAVLLTAGKVRRIMRAACLTPVKTSNYLFFPERLFAVMGRLEKWLAAVPAGGQFAVFGMRGDQSP